jgi:hypothetical protein
MAPMERPTKFTSSFASTDGTSGLPATGARGSIRSVASLALRRPRGLGTTAGLLVFTFAAFGMLAVHNFASNAIESAVRRSLQGVAIAAARSVPVEAHALIHTATDEGSPAYQQAIAPLEELVIPEVDAKVSVVPESTNTVPPLTARLPESELLAANSSVPAVTVLVPE